MRSLLQSIILSIIIPLALNAQIEVTTLIEDVKTSGGVTTSPNGNVIISDFGRSLNSQGEGTKIYEFDPKSGLLSQFGDGFAGASGAAFDREGNFYQSNARGHKVTRRNEEGLWEKEWINQGLKTPIGITVENDNIYVCNCGANNNVRINSKTAQLDTFATSPDFNCPNGLTRYYFGNSFACNFNDGKVLKQTTGRGRGLGGTFWIEGWPNPVGTGHLTWANGNLMVTTIGTGELFMISGKNTVHKNCGLPKAFTNVDGGIDQASFSKPNGITSSRSGDTLFVNCSTPSWTKAPMDLHPSPLRMIQGVCQLEHVKCWSGEEKEAVDAIMMNTNLFSKAYLDKNYEKMVTSYTIDGKIMPDGAKIISGKDDIQKRWILPEGT